MEWQVEGQIPRFEDRFFFDVWIGDAVRRVQRVGNRGPLAFTFAPGALVFSDCTHPAQNMICDETKIDGWRLREDLPTAGYFTGQASLRAWASLACPSAALASS